MNDDENELQRLGEIGYRGYADATGGVTWDNRPMPTWGELPPRIRDAWAAAARSIRDAGPAK